MTNIAQQRFSDEVTSMLKRGGWFPGRNIADTMILPSGFVIFPAAQKVLAEFGYLRLGIPGPGIECARGEINMDPMYAANDIEGYEEYGELIHRALYPLGIVDNLDYLAIDEDGTVYLFGDEFWFVGTSFDAALDTLLLGKLTPQIDENGYWETE